MRSFSPTKYSEKYHFASKYYGRMGSSPSLSTQASGYISRPQSSSPFKRIGPNPSRLHIAVNNIKEEQPDATSKSSNKTESRISEMPLSEAVMLCPKEIQDNEVEISENSNINYFWKRAAKYRHRGNFFDALKCYKKVLSFEPNHFESLVMVGICNLKLGLITEAILTYDQAIKINDKSFIPYFNKALAHIYLQQYSEAVKCMNVAGHSISNQNEIPQELFKLRALALYRSGKIASALDDMKRKNSYSKLKVSNNGQSFVESELSTHEKTFSVIRNRSQKRKSINKSFDQVFETNNNWKNPRTIEDYDTRRLNTRSVTPNLKVSPKVNSSRLQNRSFRSKPSVFFLKKSSEKRSQISTPFTSFRPSEIQSPLLWDKPMSPIKASEMKIDVSKQDKSGCFQTDLSKAQIKENILKDDDVHSKIQEKFILLHQKLEEDVQKQAAKMDDDITPLITSGLSEQNVQAIRKEYLKDKSKRDIDLIDQLVKKLSFFARFNKDIRINLLKISDLTHYKPATVIFTQEESGDNMYVILRGSVSIEKKAKEFGNQSITVNSLYDGRQFGELSLISSIQSNNQVNARAATCVASEPSEILHIPKVEYNKIILSQLRHDMESKITFLSQLPLFKGLDPILLIPLASNIETTVFDYDEVIIKKGEQPKGLYIIMKGHAAALTEGWAVKKREGSEFANVKIRKKSPKPFYTGKVAAGENETIKKDPNDDPIERLLYKEVTEATEQTWQEISKFVTKKQRDSLKTENNYLIKDTIRFATLQPMDFFGGRALLEGDVIQDSETQNPISLKRMTSDPSKFSIIAQSTVEVFIVTKYHISFLNDKVVSQLKTIIQKSYEVDCPPEIDPDMMDQLFVKWQEFRVELVEDIRRNKFIERRKADFPFIR